MPKKPKTEKPTGTMFERFAMLARKVVTTPKPDATNEKPTNKA